MQINWFGCLPLWVNIFFESSFNNKLPRSKSYSSSAHPPSRSLGRRKKRIKEKEEEEEEEEENPLITSSLLFFMDLFFPLTLSAVGRFWNILFGIICFVTLWAHETLYTSYSLSLSLSFLLALARAPVILLRRDARYYWWETIVSFLMMTSFLLLLLESAECRAWTVLNGKRSMRRPTGCRPADRLQLRRL